ncbi:hypothetical protein SAY87_021611 [Trapa incisa]|uniref:Uncharacterized protein n=1 Tax=Trapa incisa TaxID=236973 RepID=A0AAN7JXC1_9MYRT|nr:hypothetical protein SAY87_021611 [Trapa incisa]
MGRQPCCDKVGLKRGPWTIDEDHKLMSFILNNGIHCWRTVPKLAGLLRCGKSCRLRWINYLRPDLKRGHFTEAEEDQIIQLHSHLGNRWSKIASHFPGRTDNEIKNHWNTRIKKRLKLLERNPLNHMPTDDCKDSKPTSEQPLLALVEGITSPDEEKLPMAVESEAASRQDPPEVLEPRKGVEYEYEYEAELSLDEVATDLFDNYAALCGNNGTLLLGEGLLLDDVISNHANPSVSQGCSASAGDSNNNSFCKSIQSIMDDSHGNGNPPDCSPQEWHVEGCVNSVLSWDDFDYLEPGDLCFF